MILKISKILTFLMCLFISCKQDDTNQKLNNHQAIENPETQDSLFMELSRLTYKTLNVKNSTDSLAFLVVPIEAACPSCRNKTIDSIGKYLKNLDARHLIIVSGTGRSNIEKFFVERKLSLPLNNQYIYIDSTNESFILDLVFTKPTIYFSANKKIYHKSTCVPINIKDQLNHFFTKKSVSPLMTN